MDAFECIKVKITKDYDYKFTRNGGLSLRAIGNPHQWLGMHLLGDGSGLVVRSGIRVR